MVSFHWLHAADYEPSWSPGPHPGADTTRRTCGPGCPFHKHIGAPCTETAAQAPSFPYKQGSVKPALRPKLPGLLEVPSSGLLWSETQDPRAHRVVSGPAGRQKYHFCPGFCPPVAMQESCKAPSWQGWVPRSAWTSFTEPKDAPLGPVNRRNQPQATLHPEAEL